MSREIGEIAHVADTAFCVANYRALESFRTEDHWGPEPRRPGALMRRKLTAAPCASGSRLLERQAP
jgi:hypothetical protein